MMRRMDLLPEAYVRRRRERRTLAFIVLAGAFVLLGLIVWYFMTVGQISGARNDLAAVQARNASLQAEIDALQHFAELEAEVAAKRTALQTVMAGDIDWPSIMTEVAMVIPGETWLTGLTTSAGATEGASPVGTETNPIRVSTKQPVGRISFTGNSICLPSVAKWLIRLATVDEFSAVWLGSATEGDTRPGCEVATFSNTVELNDEAFSQRFQGELE